MNMVDDIGIIEPLGPKLGRVGTHLFPCFTKNWVLNLINTSSHLFIILTYSQLITISCELPLDHSFFCMLYLGY